ncbi:hypothetical protein BD410DRAFT_788439 [Rickenella mellea]|uniref:F-box domain-containing protein n=1 Tax=Rickenella mellea TaxID=50990 RepID=A0A4Y7Q5D5_9AGAM|nr:hypothetical protein BD410DRAFT_788439 [Rickenella mellea]
MAAPEKGEIESQNGKAACRLAFGFTGSQAMTSPNGPADLAQIEAEICKVEEYLANLKSQRNTFSSIYKLPPEVIAHILRRVRTNRLSLWLSVTHVCRHWRQVALDCSSLWTTVNLSEQEAKAFLERSRSALLTVRARRSGQADNKNVISLLCDNLSRIRELRLDAGRYSWHSESFDINTVFSVPAPFMEKIFIRNRWNATPPAFTFGGNYPMLKTLVVSQQRLTWHSQSIRGLTKFVLQDIHSANQPTLSELVSILDECQGLEILSR